MRARASIGIVLLAAACAPATAVLGEHDIEPADAQTARFAGTWFIEETVPHATYLASKWLMNADGTLELVEDFSMGSEAGYPAVSWVGNAHIVCHFGASWRSDDERTLRVETECTDGTNRPLDLLFDADTTKDATGVEPLGLAVDGDETMWSGPVWGWRFVKCEGDHANCAPWSPN